MEITISAKSVELAVELGAKQLGKDVSEIKYTVIEEAKKGLFGIGGTDAKITVYCDDTPEELSLGFVNTLIRNMEIDAEAEIVRVDESIPEGKTNSEKNIYIEINGTGLGILIGRHGEVLDSIQYLANIIAGRAVKASGNHGFVKVTIDVENYRAKREETLKALARRMAQKAINYRKNVTLEPMSPYERRIIHSELQNVAGVHTYSVGEDSQRRIVIAYGDEENFDEE
jgi:spoIIIJ-associated protein